MKNNRGLTLVEVLMFTAAIVLCFFGFLSTYAYVREIQIREANKFTTETLRANLSSLISDDIAWNKTFNAAQNAATLGCVKAGTCNSGGAFALLDGTGTLFFDVANAAKDGFSSEMNPCDFVNGTSDVGCPFSVRLSWSKINNSLIEVKAELLYQSHVLHTPNAMVPWVMYMVRSIP
jgi:hypothetical protein